LNFAGKVGILIAQRLLGKTREGIGAFRTSEKLRALPNYAGGTIPASKARVKKNADVPALPEKAERGRGWNKQRIMKKILVFEK